jgi:transcriptional regulator with XRE-family HTH domain
VPVVIFRRLLGEVLRARRISQGFTLRQVSADARVSLGSISEIERGQKEASSELLAAICDALEFPLPDLLSEVADAMRTVSLQPMQPLVPVGTRHADLRRAAPQPATTAPAPSPLVSVAA